MLSTGGSAIAAILGGIYRGISFLSVAARDADEFADPSSSAFARVKLVQAHPPEQAEGYPDYAKAARCPIKRAWSPAKLRRSLPIL